MRTRNPITVLGPDGKPFAGASVTTKVRATGSFASVYATESGGSAGANPDTTDANGRITQWLERGAYSSTITGPGLDPYVEHWESTPGSDGGIDLSWIPDALLTAAKLIAGLRPSAGATASTEALRALGSTADKAASGNDSRIPTQDENDALGGTSGAPSATNKYVTDSDSRLTTILGLLTPKRAVGYSATQTVANNTVAELALTTEDFDNDGIHAANSSRMVIVTAGVYRCLGKARVGPNTNSTVQVGLELCLLSGGTTTVLDSEPVPSGGYETFHAAAVLRTLTLAAGDQIFLRFSTATGTGGPVIVTRIQLEVVRVSA